MEEYVYLCQQCNNLFDLSVLPGPEEEKEVKCTECQSMNVERLNVWISNVCSLEEGPPAWEYTCHQCKTFFRLLVPHGPKEEEEAECPQCKSRDIERVNVYTPTYSTPGG